MQYLYEGLEILLGRQLLYYKRQHLGTCKLLYTKLLNNNWRLVITTRARACSARRRAYWIKIGLGLGMITFSRQRLECAQFRLG